MYKEDSPKNITQNFIICKFRLRLKNKHCNIVLYLNMNIIENKIRY